ncbi:hypothetical protein [Bacillus sp. UMB0728]|uniref:hypothetical protein n=1 Tax=Bacillus sp. UMB0728 TaxID=2066052 RepID=UPI000C7689E8|nr:hypothetical protein [Bacillus sp. UMB0728]PLR72251.1 hypothetical protein CYJ37_11895 [Bacillus sp. UMB0728]
MEFRESFELKSEHLKLLQNMYVGWRDIETGAPRIDPKRPYGNSDVIQDIHFILTGSHLEEQNINSLEEHYMTLHREMETVLQIVLHTMSFETGKYCKEGFGKDWVKSN